MEQHFVLVIIVFAFVFYLGKNPVTGESWGDGGKCEFKAAKTTVCCVNPNEVDECPAPDYK